jgi:23S rRNA (guanosine2251-2'-O)-methyltransferase
MKKEPGSSYQVIYGIHPVRETLLSGSLQTLRVFIGTKHPNPTLQSILDLAHRNRVPVTFSSREEMDRMTGGGNHQHIVGIVQEFPYADLDEVLGSIKPETQKKLFLILDGIQDPQNLGALIRTASGAGVHAVILPKDRAAGITPSVIKASAGATAHLPVVRVVNVANTIDRLKQEGIWVYGAESSGGNPLYDLDLTTDLAIVIGSEGKGIRPLVEKKCDALFTIPMVGPISSFNASVSGGMILYEVMRQRHQAERKLKP